MKSYVGIGVSIGLLAGIWTQLSSTLGLMTWVAFIGAALYFGTLAADPAPAAWVTGLVLVIGVAFAFTSDVLGARIQSLVERRTPAATEPVPAAAQPA